MIKRGFDFVFSLIGLLIFSPIMLLTALSILINMGRPIFFCQLRPGLNGRPFYVLKFRTMSVLYDSEGNLLPDGNRLTSLGKLLRKLSLDEIPQLINVIKGDMSLVGPRPLLMEYLPLYSKEQMRRHLVRPGITGYAQIGGRNNISWNERFLLDIWYVDNASFLLDIKILIITVSKVIKREGINAPKTETMKKFEGS